MRIATVCFSATLGGLELATLWRAVELREHGHEIVVVIPDADALSAEASRLGLNTEIITPTLPYLDLPAARKLAAVFDRHRTEAAIVGRTRDLSTVMIAAGKDVAVVLYQQMQFGQSKRDWFHNRVYARLDACITLTERGRQAFIDHTVLASEKIVVVPYGLDCERYRPDVVAIDEARALYNLPLPVTEPVAPFVAGLIGRFDSAKGQREFIAALGLAAEREPALAAVLHGVLVGRQPGNDPTYIDELEAVRLALPLAERVVVHPFVSDPRAAFRALDVFVLASHAETFGMVVQQAMAMGTPVIATDAGGVPEIVQHGVTGLLVPPKDAEAIADALVMLYRDGELRARLSVNALAFARERYDAERQYSAFQSVVESAIARRHG